jgi:hypothetical protein
MKKNEHAIDRIIRIVVAALIVALIAMKIVTGTPAILLGVVAGVFFLTGAVGICGIYLLLGLSTCKVAK